MDEFEAALAGSRPEVRALARAARTLIREVYPEVVEVPWPRQRVVGYGVGPKKMSEHFCYLALHNDHLNLGFNYGAELPDPGELLGGPGKLLRHTRIATLGDLERPELRALLEYASRHRMPAVPSHLARSKA